MTKVLIFTNKADITSDFIVQRLKEREIGFYRFNTEDLLNSISLTFDFQSNSCLLYDKYLDDKINLKEFSAVYFRRPKVPEFTINQLTEGEKGFLRKEFIYLLEGVYKATRESYWVSPLYAIREAENKVFQLELARSIGFNIPKSLISNSYHECKKFYEDSNKNCVLKPIKSGLIEEDGSNSNVIFTSKLTEFPSNKERIESFPLFIQEEIEKEGDVRAIVVGNKVFATLIHSQDHLETKTDWRRGEVNLKHTRITLPSSLTNKCIELLVKLNLRFGAIDFVLDKNGDYFFLEINPNGQWGWIENKTGYNISSEIVNLLQYEYPLESA